MNRNKWKSSYDAKCEVLLGISHKTAMSQLERKIIFHLAKKLELTKCYHCGFDIEDSNDLSIEHINPWGGNKKKGLNPNPNYFWDMDNIAFSHKTCNCSAASAGTGRLKYMGINYVFDKRKGNPKEKARASICVNGRPWTLGEYTDHKEGAIAYDLAVMYFRKGIGKVNFENLREDYQQYIEENIDNESFFRVREGKIKPAVEFLKDKLDDN